MSTTAPKKATTKPRASRAANALKYKDVDDQKINILQEGKRTAKDLLNTISEGSELTYQTIATITDALIVYRATTHREALQELVNSGMTEEEAEELLAGYRKR